MKRITLSALLMTLFLLLSCGGGSAKAEDPQSRFLKSLISLSNDFLNVFTSFADMLGGVLGFNTNTKKSDIGNYFKTIETSLTTTKTALNKIVADMKSENNPNASITETAVNKLVSETLSKIIDGAKTASEAIGSDNNPIANVAVGGAGDAAKGIAGTEVEKLVNGIKSIVDVVLGDKEGNPEAGDNKKADVLGARNAGDGEAGKLFASDHAGDDADKAKKAAADAAKAIGAVTGADILQAMVKNEDAAKLAKNNAASAGINAALANKKDAVIAGGIALRAIAKDGKFANANNAANDDAKKAVEDAAVSTVTKALNTLTIAIRSTINEGLKSVKDAMKINPEDTPVTTDNQTPEIKKN
ncbi:variable large family protein [Borrelia turicatae]|uniref:variable large family protein n=1 Tax=Borrelia turicatae TaxID=142 RepID=UPI002ED114B6